MTRNIAIVVIGRNEGERLVKCLESVVAVVKEVIYVDSGSTDTSVETALAMGIDVVKLDMHESFTAARARNEGFRRALELNPDLEYVHFFDGDCEAAASWIEKAAGFLNTHQEAAVVYGRLRERHPERSIYNMLCNIEWDTPIGEALACGGNALMRVDAFERAAGFRAAMIAGEEPELCVRLRAAGWRIWRLDADMGLHDAGITRFSQWWMRAKRGGYAFAEGVVLHGSPPERHWVRESRSAWFWGLAIPVAAVIGCLAFGAAGLALFLVYPLQVLRLFVRGARSQRENFWRALFLVLGKFPEMLGQVTYWMNRYVNNRSRLIEYK